MEAQDIGPDAMASIYQIESHLINDGWDVEVHIDEESVIREDGIIDCVWVQATRPVQSLDKAAASLQAAGVLSGWIKVGSDEHVIVGGLLMPIGADD